MVPRFSDGNTKTGLLILLLKTVGIFWFLVVTPVSLAWATPVCPTLAAAGPRHLALSLWQLAVG